MKKKIILLISGLILSGLCIISSQTAKPDIVVAKDGSGNFKTVQEAVNSVPDSNTKWITVFIKNGIYKEVVTVPVNKTFIRFIGENKEQTILTFDNYHSLAGGTEKSSSTFFKADNLIAENITFQNSYDYYKSPSPQEQAVALTTTGDKHIFINCNFKGIQDTLFIKVGRNYFKNCYIEGITDFIFGDGVAFFDECKIHLLINASYIAAPSTLETSKYGLIFNKCVLSADKKLPKNSVYLGRPWHPSSFKVPMKSNAVFLNCDLGNYIRETGWSSMGSVYPKTERLLEYKNKGQSAIINESRPQLSDAALYTASEILKGNDNWDFNALIK